MILWGQTEETAHQMSNVKQRHHYVPIAYLKAFTAPNGRVWAYRKDEPDSPLHLRPAAIAFERYYYSQPLEDGGRDHNTLEDFFSQLEGEWPPLVARLEKGTAAGDDIGILHEFLGLMRIRVPAARDMIELSLAEVVKAATRAMDRAGALPPKPEGMEDILDHLTVAVDPHRSLLAMPALLQGLSRLLDMIGLQIVHNDTGVDFITSDNPVVWFDPAVPEDQMQPYRVDRSLERVELLFPMTPRLLLRGHSSMRGSRSLKHVRLRATSEVKRINRHTARFGYRFVFSNSDSYGVLVKKYAAMSPTIRMQSIPGSAGEFLFSEGVFAPRVPKMKWEGA
jgi:Protein of unknown function (DUF4238)